MHSESGGGGGDDDDELVRERWYDSNREWKALASAMFLNTIVTVNWCREFRDF